MTARAVLAAGEVSLSIWDTVNQAWSGFGDYFDADKFQITPQFEELTSESRARADYGQARASVIKPRPTEIAIDLSAGSVKALAMQFQGLVQTLTQASGSLAAQSVTLQGVGVWVSVGKRNLASSGFSLTNTAGTTTYVLGTHYEVNWQRGEIRPLAASGAPGGTDSVKVTGTYNAVDGSKILGGRVSQVRVQARFDGANMVDGSPIEVDVWEAVLSAGSGFDFLAAGFTPISLTGKLVKPANKTEAYEVRLPATTA